MKIQLPNGEKLNLDEHITLDEKKQLVEELTIEWKSIIISNWDSNSVRYFLDGLGNYLVWHKEEEMKNKQDKDVLSIKKIEQMEGKRRNTSVPMSCLSVKDKEYLGIDGVRN